MQGKEMEQKQGRDGWLERGGVWKGDGDVAGDGE